MLLRRIFARTAIGLLAGALGLSLAAVPAQATNGGRLGDRSLAAVLTSDGNRFDRNWSDYDIVTEAVLAVLDAKPHSPVGVLADGSVALTAFIPNDRAFRVLAKDLTGRWYASERTVFNRLVEAVGVDAIEAVLLYHVVPGATITAKAALRADGASLTTAQGGTIEVDVKSRWLRLIKLRDQDPNDANPYINPRAFNLNLGNRQIAHGITLVLRPLDL